MLKTVLEKEMRERNLSSHKAADEIGVSHTTVLRALRGDVVDLKTVVAVADWLGVRPASLVNSFSAAPPLGDQVQILLARYPEIKDVLQEAVSKTVSGEVDAAIVADIIAYAAYKIGAHEKGRTAIVGKGRQGTKPRAARRTS